MKKTVLTVSALLFLFPLFGQISTDDAFSESQHNGDWIKVNQEIRVSPDLFFEDYSASLGLSKRDRMIFSDVRTDAYGFSHHRYQQYFQQYPVEGAMYILHARDGIITHANGKLIRDIHVADSPAVSAGQAIELAKQHMGAARYAWENPKLEERIKMIKRDPAATFYPTPELVIADKNFQSDGSAYVLAWKVDLLADNPTERKIIYLDAVTGEFLFDLSGCQEESVVGTAVTRYHGTQTIVADSVSPMSFRLVDSTRGGSITTYDLNTLEDESKGVHFYDEDNFWDNANERFDDAATDVHWGMEMTYDYYLQHHGRDSYDDQGAPIISYVHYDTAWSNARWTGWWALFGDGSNNPLTSIDVVSHELTHGVTGNSAGLIYRNESGALNESFSDIFGTTVEFFALPDEADWLIGKANFILRDMANPNARSQPDTYKGDMWYTGSGDNGGVHYNSGVQNYWFYLLSNGGAGVNDFGNAFDVDSLGMEVAAAIAYRTLNYYLTPGSQYLDARLGSLQAAEDLFGTCSPEVQTVMHAWYAVGVGIDDFTPDLQALSILGPISSCDISDSEDVTFLFRNNRTGCGHFLNKGDTLELSYQVDNNPPVLETYVIPSILNGGDTITYTFATPLDLSVAGAYSVDARVKYNGDIYASNDAVLDYPVTKTYRMTDQDVLTFNFNASADTFFTETRSHSEAAMTFAAAHTGSRGFQINGKNATPENVTPAMSEEENFVLNPQFHAKLCMCVEAEDWAHVLLDFDLRQTYALYYEEILGIDFSYAIALRVLVNGEQIGEQFHPMTNSDDPFVTHTMILDEYAGTNFELCFEGVHFLRKFDLPGDPGDQSYLDNIRLSNMSVLDVEETIQTPVVVYPNPTDGMVYVEVESGEKQVVSIIDPLGRKVYEQIWIPLGERLPLDLSSFPSGQYTVVVTSDSGQTAERIVRE